MSADPYAPPGASAETVEGPEVAEVREAMLEDMIERGPTIEAISPLMRAEIDIQISTAKKFPRSIRRFQQDAKTMATMDEETAISCMYSLPRAGKSIEGPSVRLAEIVAACWQNLRVGARVVEEGDTFLTAQGFCHDLERNLASTIEVRRRITYKNGKRFNDDMIIVAGNAAASIAYRNAVFKVVPKAYWNPVFIEARKTALGELKTLVSRRNQAFDYWKKAGATEQQILGVLGKASVEDVGLEELLRLRTLFTAIKEGTLTMEAAFKPPEREQPSGPAAPRVNLKGNGKPAEPASPPAAENAGDALEREDLVRRLKESIDEAKMADDLGNVQSELLKHRDFLGKHYDELAAAARQKSALLNPGPAKLFKERDTTF